MIPYIFSLTISPRRCQCFPKPREPEPWGQCHGAQATLSPQGGDGRTLQTASPADTAYSARPLSASGIQPAVTHPLGIAINATLGYLQPQR